MINFINILHCSLEHFLGFNITGILHFMVIILFICGVGLYLAGLVAKEQRKHFFRGGGWCFGIWLLVFLYVAGALMKSPEYWWGNFRVTYTHHSINYAASLISAVYRDHAVPDNYVYYGPFSQKYYSGLLHKYGSAATQGEQFFELKLAFPCDTFVSGNNHMPHCGYLDYTCFDGGDLMLYINGEKGFCVFWGVGPNLRSDLTKKKIDQLYADGKMDSLKFADSLKECNDYSDIFPLDSIETVFGSGVYREVYTNIGGRIEYKCSDVYTPHNLNLNPEQEGGENNE